ncbi:universal stress protein [Solwaraspora sp. WMMD1047]|uniref:universal stress protein n=1 Tax=Solwaraspora sp. WMMD1047 TaxID=3016102 RepID=UPI00241689CB|nr:universal stress protein [Solwaraspora sp. WMMD1047]MDG4830926.1 universal stress protein [Solwaraspora sp. WMMD1047]
METAHGTTDRGRIAVGFDGSPAARAALAWALREADRRQSRVLVVTAWPTADRATARRRDDLVTARLRLQRRQRDAVAAAGAGLVPIPPVATEVVLADPVTALCHAADFADLVVVGGGGPATDTGAVRTGDALTARLARRRGPQPPVPVVVVAAPTEPAAAEGGTGRDRQRTATSGMARLPG